MNSSVHPRPYAPSPICSTQRQLPLGRDFSRARHDAASPRAPCQDQPLRACVPVCQGRVRVGVVLIMWPWLACVFLSSMAWRVSVSPPHTHTERERERERDCVRACVCPLLRVRMCMSLLPGTGFDRRWTRCCSPRMQTACSARRHTWTKRSRYMRAAWGIKGRMGRHVVRGR